MTERAIGEPRRWSRGNVMAYIACLVVIAATPYCYYWLGQRNLSEAIVASAVAVVITAGLLAFLPGFSLVFCFPFVAWGAGLNIWLSLGFLALLAIVKTLALLDRRDAEMAEKANTKRIEEASNSD